LAVKDTHQMGIMRGPQLSVKRGSVTTVSCVHPVSGAGRGRRICENAVVVCGEQSLIFSQDPESIEKIQKRGAVGKKRKTAKC
jgi:hypothetical protein